MGAVEQHDRTRGATLSSCRHLRKRSFANTTVQPRTNKTLRRSPNALVRRLPSEHVHGQKYGDAPEYLGSPGPGRFTP